jgi:hypothetical protein
MSKQNAKKIFTTEGLKLGEVLAQSKVEISSWMAATINQVFDENIPADKKDISLYLYKHKKDLSVMLNTEPDKGCCFDGRIMYQGKRLSTLQLYVDISYDKPVSISLLKAVDPNV